MSEPKRFLALEVAWADIEDTLNDSDYEGYVLVSIVAKSSTKAVIILRNKAML